MPILYLLLAISFIVLIILRPIIRGKKGEMSVTLHLKSLPKSQYTVLNNLLIQKGGHSSQIDHVVVSRYGVFVIETKDYKGTIYGSEDNYHWTQNIWGNKYELYNLILQNQGHVKALKAYLGVGNFPFIPIVTFSTRANLRINTKENAVLYYSEIVRFIESKKIVLLSDAEIETTVKMLSRLPKYTRKESSKHIKQVRSQINKSQKAVYNGKCPKCGGTLIKRNGQYGTFYGCSNYPKCKFTTK